LWGLLSEDLVKKLYWGLTGFELEANMRKNFPDDSLGIAPKKFGETEMVEIMKGGTFEDRTNITQGGVVFEPSILGMDLFLRAQGLPPRGVISFGDRSSEAFIGFDSLKSDFRPERFAEEILKDVRLVSGSAPPQSGKGEDENE